MSAAFSLGRAARRCSPAHAQSRPLLCYLIAVLAPHRGAPMDFYELL